MDVFLLFLEAIYCLYNFLYCYYYIVLLSLLHIPYSEIVVDGSDQPQYGVHSLSPDREGCLGDLRFEHLPIVNIASMDQDDEVRIVAWRFTEETSGQEAILNDNQPREETTHESVKHEGEYSGVFRIRSVFWVPGGDTHTMYGTAFVVNQFQAMTSAHLLWHAQLGPAKEVTLIKDAREQENGEAMYTCLGAACYKSAIRSIVLQEHSPKHDLCMVSVSPAFEPGIRFLPLHPGSGLPYGNSGSPVIAGNYVVGVHHGFKADSMRNEAAPVNQNGNNANDLISVLQKMGNQHKLEVAERLRELRRVKGPEFPKRELRYYGLS
ncbi:hypothetical protein NPX13_g8371 [Xylaria arbuscula]|uniref:Peptidase S1 domain-containing protein n=1 Tax=Xylaria arbuscula TaxID=114810 RepID=A0A9W8N8V4_9PEZI|nr:hypothetical protein NPX13_g8371 [Xylaria arbuscula]